MSPKTDDMKPDSRKKPYQKPQMRRLGTIAQIARRWEEGQSILPLHPRALTALAQKCEVLALQTRENGDVTQDVGQAAAQYAFADKCDSRAQELYGLAARMTAAATDKGG